MVDLQYLAIGLLRRMLPLSAHYALMRIRGNGSLMEDRPAEGIARLRDSMSRSGVDISNRHVVDLGSGRFARGGIALLAAGARRVTLVDLYATPLEDPSHRAMLVRDCLELGLDESHALAHINVLRNDFLSLPLPPDTDRPDLIVSSFVLEHVSDPGAILLHCYRWLRPGGRTLHLFDLRDHNAGFRQPFEMLAYSEKMWSRWLNLSGGFHLNRWRAPDYRQAMEASGFVQIREDIVQADLQGAQTIRPRLDPCFQKFSDEELAIQIVALTGERPL